MEEKNPADMSAKEFIEWFVKEYDGHWLASDYTSTINRLEGYLYAKQGSEEYSMLSSALDLLRDAQTLLRITKQYTNYKL
jgi:hypothetical protein